MPEDRGLAEEAAIGGRGFGGWVQPLFFFRACNQEESRTYYQAMNGRLILGRLNFNRSLFMAITRFSALMLVLASGFIAQIALAQASAASPAERLKEELSQVGVERFTAPDYKPGVLRHIVLFRYAKGITASQKQDVQRRFLNLAKLGKRDGRPYILSIEAGAENSGEGADQGLEQGYIVTFKSQGDRNYYVGQPVVTDSRHFDLVHQAFKDFVGPQLDDNGVIVFDFTPGK